MFVKLNDPRDKLHYVFFLLAMKVTALLLHD